MPRKLADPRGNSILFKWAKYDIFVHVQDLLLRPASDDASLLTHAVVRIAELWKLSHAKLGAILGLSSSTVSRMRAGRARLDPQSKSFEAAQYLLRLFRSLDALLGSNDQASQSWLRTRNIDLEQAPLDSIESFRGLMEVCDYVDGYRAQI